MTDVRCTAHAKATGKPCRRYPMTGGTVCYVHGGAAGETKAAAARRQELAKVEAEVAVVLAAESHAGVVDPLKLMSELTAEAVALKNAWKQMVDKLEGNLRYSATGTGNEQIRAEVSLYERGLDRAAKFADLMIRGDFDNRRLLLQEYLAKTAGALMGKWMDDLMDSLRDELIAAGADAVEPDFPTVWKDAIGRTFPTAFRAMGARLEREAGR
jgi:hypothetical protein